jgi:hypothetical protein
MHAPATEELALCGNLPLGRNLEPPVRQHIRGRDREVALITAPAASLAAAPTRLRAVETAAAGAAVGVGPAEAADATTLGGAAGGWPCRTAWPPPPWSDGSAPGRRRSGSCWSP